MLSKEELSDIVFLSRDRSLNVLWNSWLEHKEQEFVVRRQIFLWIVENLLAEGEIRLHKNREILLGTIEEQLKDLRQAFPTSEQDADQRCTKPGFEAPYPGFGMNVWWFLDICPAGVAWRQPDGSYLIAD